MSNNHTLTNFIPTLPVRCDHTNLPDANFCSTCGAQLPTDFTPYFRHWFYTYVYETLQTIFEDKQSVYTLLDKLVFYENPLEYNPRDYTDSGDIRVGQFVQGNDEGEFYPTVGVADDNFDPFGYYVQQNTLPGGTGYGCIEPANFFDRLNTQYINNYEYVICYSFEWDHKTLQQLDANRPTEFEPFAIAVMTHLDTKASFDFRISEY